MKGAFLMALLLAAALTPASAQRKRHYGTGVVLAAPPPPEIYRYVSEQARFPGDVRGWVQQHLHYPEGAREAGWEGTVQVVFEVKANGAVEVIQVKKSSGYPTLDNEARRVIGAMPPWKPAKVNGRAISTIMLLPVIFRLR